jgi:death-on-curing protein
VSGGYCDGVQRQISMVQHWTWVTVAVAKAVHAEQLAEHGGGDGVRDEALLESALMRRAIKRLDAARDIAGYGTPDAAALAAA